MTKTVLLTVALGLAFVASPLGAAAEEAKTPVVPLILDLTTPRIESYDAAFNQMLREDGPAPRRSPTEGKVLPDGSVQYGEGNGSVIVTVRNPCPEGSGHYEPRPLPGRRARN
jgi:hypothetical protein